MAPPGQVGVRQVGQALQGRLRKLPRRLRRRLRRWLQPLALVQLWRRRLRAVGWLLHPREAWVKAARAV